MQKLGIIGGVGPMATALFMEYIIEMTDAAVDSEHIDMLIHNCPQIPDRTQFILGRSNDDPSIRMIEIGKMLETNGCELIAIPCITANFFYDKVSGALTKPLLDGVEETAALINDSRNRINKVGIMATDGTVKSGLFQRALGQYDIECVVPSEDNQKLVMSLIYDDVKAGRPMDNSVYDKLNKVSCELYSNGANIIILGCTELSVIGKAMGLKDGYVDALRALAQKAVINCGSLKSEYEDLVKPLTT